VDTSWTIKVDNFKSPIRVVAAFLLRSRETQANQVQRLKEQLEDRDKRIEYQQRELLKHKQQVAQALQRTAELNHQLERARRSVNLPDDPSIGTHGYGPRMISLAVNLARATGLRGACRVLRILFEWLGIPTKTPSRNAIRGWLQRLGIAELKRPLDPRDDLVIMLDHSIQIGTEKVLVAFGVHASNMPAPGETMRHEHVRVLEVKPGKDWKTEDMTAEYESLAKRYGVPRAVLVDGAAELRDGAECLKNQREDMLVIRDFKHYAANVLKSLVGNDPAFKEVTSHMGTTRSAIQQTELAHLIPPAPKQKARFMNLATTLRWMTLIVWLFRNPNAQCLQGIKRERIEAKLGWVAGYADRIAEWHECQEVVSMSVTFINRQHLFKGASAALRSELGESLQFPKSRELAERLLTFVAEAEQELRDGERLPMSTEILESAFGLYKQLERQHSKSGYTSLLACLPALLKPTTPEQIHKDFARVSAIDVQTWSKKHFPSTVNSRRQSTYAEHKRATTMLTPT
jgi:hypothetical protein